MKRRKGVGGGGSVCWNACRTVNIDTALLDLENIQALILNLLLHITCKISIFVHFPEPDDHTKHEKRLQYRAISRPPADRALSGKNKH